MEACRRTRSSRADRGVPGRNCRFHAPSTGNCSKCRPSQLPDANKTLPTTQRERCHPPSTPHRTLERRPRWQRHLDFRPCRVWQDHAAGRVGADDRSPHSLAFPGCQRRRAARLRALAHCRPPNGLSRCIQGHGQLAQGSAVSITG
jgi:hypothetical protein